MLGTAWRLNVSLILLRCIRLHKMDPPAMYPPAILPLLFPAPEKTGCALNSIRPHDYASVAEAGILI
jgi:hypothetical protein